jgi:uncharacterized membrane protein
MTWAIFALGAALSWGIYGVLLYKGQVGLGNPMKALLCVGVAYFLLGVLVPAASLSSSGGVSGFSTGATTMATIAGLLGAAGAICIIYAFKNGGVPTYVMPIVFGGAPVVNVILSMTLLPPKEQVSPLLYLGILVTAIGASMVLYFKPTH